MRGQMLQADGSIHDWLEGRGPKLTLIAYIDDATNEVYATFREQEDAAGYMEVLQEICLREGIPQSVYMDKRLSSRKKASLAEQLAGKEPKSQFERVLEELGIELIYCPLPAGQRAHRAVIWNPAGPLGQGFTRSRCRQSGKNQWGAEKISAEVQSTIRGESGAE